MVKELRSGYTTGMCSAVASLVALKLLVGEEIEKVIHINSLNGIKLDIPVENSKKVGNWARGVVIKDAGDDPDVTNGIEICSKVKIVKEFPKIDRAIILEDIMIVGGYGVGVVTKKGLKIKVGKSAINPGPQKMIFEALQPIVKKYKIKIVVTLYVPKGRERAKKTFNEKLGVLGGISILGSTGIVKPMSEEALTRSMYTELKVLKENSFKDWVVFTFGNHGKRFCEENGIDLERMVVTSNYIGFMIDSAVKLGFKRALMIGHIGKAVKVAGGIFNTHSRVADARLEIIASNAVYIDEPRENILKVLRANTAEEACEYILKKEMLFNLIANKVANRCYEHSRKEMLFESIIFNYSGEILGCSDRFFEMLEVLQNDEK